MAMTKETTDYVKYKDQRETNFAKEHLLMQPTCTKLIRG